MKALVSDLEDNFYKITFFCNLEKIEKRFKKESFKEFPIIKRKFLDYYYSSQKNCDYYLQLEEYKKLNAILDNNVICDNIINNP